MLLPSCRAVTNNEKPDGNTIINRSDSQKPKGTEINVSLSKVGPMSGALTVENISPSPVYLGYLPGIGTREAAFVSLGLEKRNPTTDKFESADETDFAPGSNPLGPKESFTYQFKVATKGDYRVNIRYLIDPEWSDRLNASSFLDREERLKEADEFQDRLHKLVAIVTTAPIDL